MPIKALPGEGRQGFILRWMRQEGRVDVNDIAQALQVSEMTVRRDLARLDDEGLVRRVHGGAIERLTRFSSRTSVLPDEKARIGREVARLVQPGDTVGIDLGTSCREVAKQLSLRGDLLAVTNSIHAAVEFQYSSSQVIVLGGLMNAEAALVNGDVLEYRRNLHLDKLVLGCAGISAANGVSYFDLAETEVRKGLLSDVDVVILAADHSKFDRRKPFVLGELDIVDVLVTTEQPTGELRNALDRASVQVIVAQS